MYIYIALVPRSRPSVPKNASDSTLAPTDPTPWLDCDARMVRTGQGGEQGVQPAAFHP